MKRITIYLFIVLSYLLFSCKSTQGENKANSSSQAIEEKTTVLKEGITEHLGEIDMENSIMIANIGINEFETEDGVNKEALSFEIKMSETNNEFIYMEVGTIFEHKKQKWKVVSIDMEGNNTNEKGNGGKTVTFSKVN